MKLAWKLVVFTFLINISSGMMVNIIGFNPDDSMDYNEQMLSDIDIYGVGENQTLVDSTIAYTDFNWAENLLNIVGLGFLVDLMDFMSDYLYGIVPIILSFIPGNSNVYEPYLYGLITLIYTISIFTLFTGKEINGDG